MADTVKQIIVIDREFGAGGRSIGEQLARRLQWKLFDEELTQEIARLAKIPVELCRRHEERTDPFLRRLINLIWRGSFDRNLPSPDLAILDTDRLVSLIQHVIEQAAAARPCVIVGRGAPYFLRSRTDILSIFLYGSREEKFHRVRRDVGDEKEAINLVDTMDHDRRKFVKHYFGHKWPNRQFFHAMLNTDIGDDATIEAILGLLDSVTRVAGGRDA